MSEESEAKKFARSTSMHGVEKMVGEEKGCAERGFWTLIFVTAAILMLVVIAGIVEGFLENPTVMSTTLVHRDSAPLPSLLICPRRIFNASALLEFASRRRKLNSTVLFSG